MGGPTRLKLVAQVTRLKPDCNCLPGSQGLSVYPQLVTWMLLGRWCAGGHNPKSPSGSAYQSARTLSSLDLCYRVSTPTNHAQSFQGPSWCSPRALKFFYQEQSYPIFLPALTCSLAHFKNSSSWALYSLTCSSWNC